MSEQDPLFLALKGAGEPVELVGGKGAALDRLIGAGAPVPACGVLTTAAYRVFVSGGVLRALIDALVHEPVPAPALHDQERQRIDEAFLDAPMPPALEEGIAALAAQVGGHRVLAIRSSATAEDMGHVSFAGQYRSFLDVAAADVERAVRLTWASLWHPAPRSYRRFHGVDEGDLAMAVIAMQMLTPTVAGVAFTRDPAGAVGVMRVELVHGLGEALVSGEVTPDAFLLDPAADGHVLAKVAPPLAALLPVAERIARQLGAPQDIEWAVEGDRLWILQSRPITTQADAGTDDGFDVRAPDADDLTTAGIAEMLPGVLPPRVWETDSWLVEDAFRRLFAGLGGRVDELAAHHGLLVRYRARAALDLERMRAVVGSIPGGSTTELEYQYFGEATSGAPTAAAHGGVVQGMRTLRARVRAAEESEVVVRIVDLLLDADPELTKFDDDALVALSARVLHFAARAMAAEVAVAAMAAASYRGVEAMLARHLDGDSSEQATEVAQRITGRRGAAGSAIATALRALVDEVRGDEQLTEAVQAAEHPGQLDHSTAGEALRIRYESAMRRAGSRALFGGPTWEEDPDQAWRTFRAFIARPSAARLEEHERLAACRVIEDRVHLDPRWRVTRAMSGQLVDARRAFLRREADDAAALLERRERTKAAVLMLGGLSRRIDLEVGRRLVDRDLLDAAGDIELLTIDESARLLRGGAASGGPSRAVIGNRRHRLAAAEVDGPLPRRFRGEPPPSSRRATGTVFHGWGASSGRYEGVARVVDTSSSTGLRRGDVLVARSTDASWVPLFLVAGAIVVEEGGPLSHAAIVARELGVPAVVNVPGIVDRLSRAADEVSVTVDGSSGEVSLHTSGTPELAGVVPLRDPLSALERPPAGFHVFVTGLIGVSASLSAVVALTEAIGGARGRARIRRHAEPVAQMAAAGVLEGYEAVTANRVGVRSRRWYAVVAAVLVLATAAFGARSAIGYWRSDADDVRATLGWAAACTSAATFAVGAAAAGLAARRWPRVPQSVRRITARRFEGPRLVDVLGKPFLAVAATALALVGLLAALVTVRFGPLQRFDRWLYDRSDAGGGADRWAPDWMNVLGKPAVVIALAVVLALIAFRCRVLAPSVPAAIVSTGLTVLALTWLTMRDRPPLGGHAGEQNSFPGGHTAQLTVLFGVLPLVVQVLTAHRWVHLVARVLSTALLALVLADTLRTGGHWPTDQLAGVLLASAILVVVHRHVATADHSRCGPHPAISARRRS